jgi:hypothetical protein
VTDERERTAVHEAGHAVAGYLLGRRPDWVTIRPSADYSGLTTYLRRGGGPVVIPDQKPVGWPVVGMDARSRRVSEVSMLVVLAGHAAERVYCAPSEAREGLHSVVDVDAPDWRGHVHDATAAFEMALRQSPGAARELVEYLFLEAIHLAWSSRWARRARWIASRRSSALKAQRPSGNVRSEAAAK